MEIKDIYLSAQDFLEGSYKGVYSETVEPNNWELSIQTDDFTLTIDYTSYHDDDRVAYYQNYRDGHGYGITLGETGCLTEKGIKNVTEELITRLKQVLYGQSVVAPGKHVDLVSQLGAAKIKIKGLEKQLDSLQGHSQYSKEDQLRQDLLACLYNDDSVKYEQTLKNAKENGVSISTDSELMTGIYRDITKFYYKHGFSWLEKYVVNPHKYIKVDSI